MRHDALNEILLSADSSAEIVRRLYDLRKAENAKYSLAFLCRAAGIKSKGYLADVMNGRRKLNPDYWEGLAHGLGLDGLRSELFHLLLEHDVAEEESRADLATQIAAHRKAVAASDETMPERLRGMFFAFEVFCAFGLYKNQPTREELGSYFGRAMGVELDSALHLLISAGLAELNDGRYKLLRDTIKFVDSEDGISLQNFVRLSIESAMLEVDRWIPKSSESYYESNLISVRTADYLKELPRIKDTLRKIQTGLESSDADMILRFNIQVYPSR